MKIRVFFSMLLICVLAFSASADEMKQAIAIMDFQPKGADASSASIVSDLFRDFIVSYNQFIVVDRASMESILQEQNLQQELGCSSEECAVNLGKILGVSNIVIGTLGRLGNISIISARVVNIENAKIEWSRSAKVSDFGQIDSIVNALVDDMVKTILHGQVTKPVQTQTQQQVQTNVQTQQQQTKKEDSGQNVIVIQQQQQQQQQQQMTTMPVQYPTYKSTVDMGVELELALFPSQNYYGYLDLEFYSFNYSLEEYSNPGYFSLDLGFFWELIYLGFSMDRHSFSEGDIFTRDIEGSSTDYVWANDWSHTFTDLILGLRVPSSSGRTMINFIWKSYSYDDIESESSYKGPGIGFNVRSGSPKVTNPNAFPITLLFDLSLSGAYLFYQEEGWESVDYFSGAVAVEGNIGLGVMLKKYGAFAKLGYHVNAFISWQEDYLYDSYYGTYYWFYGESNIVDHGLYFSIGMVFNMGAFN